MRINLFLSLKCSFSKKGLLYWTPFNLAGTELQTVALTIKTNKQKIKVKTEKKSVNERIA